MGVGEGEAVMMLAAVVARRRRRGHVTPVSASVKHHRGTRSAEEALDVDATTDESTTSTTVVASPPAAHWLPYIFTSDQGFDVCPISGSTQAQAQIRMGLTPLAACAPL